MKFKVKDVGTNIALADTLIPTPVLYFIYLILTLSKLYEWLQTLMTNIYIFML